MGITIKDNEWARERNNDELRREQARAKAQALRTPEQKRLDRKRKARNVLTGVGVGAAIGILGLIAIIASVVLIALGVWIIYINALDIQDKGVNFWNIVWIIVGSIIVLNALGFGGSVASRR